MDADRLGNLLASILTTAAWTTLAIVLLQAGDELLLEVAAWHHIERVVDGLMPNLSA